MSGGGQPARWGFLFSDLVVARRILRHQVDVLRASLNGVEGPPDITFAVESTLPTSARDWDIQERRTGGVFVVEEVKSGPVSAEARRVLWKRIRDAVNSDPTAVVVPRLTTDKANPTSHPGRWAALSRQSVAAAVGSASTTFTSAENLAAEALYCLTSTDKDPEGTPLFEGPALSEAIARKTLAAFEFLDALEARELEEDIRGAVELFAKSAAAEQICNAVIGDIVQRAASPDAARRLFTAKDIWSSAQLLSDLSALPAPQIKLWQGLKAASEPPEVFGASALAYQDWRTDQLVQDLRSFVAEGLRNSPGLIRDVYWPAARDGRSSTALLTLLEALVDVYPAQSALLAEVLLLTRLFHVLEAHAALHDAISKAWAGLTTDQKNGVLAAIRSLAKSPCMNGMYAVAPLASAIPESELPPEFRPYFELFKLRGLTPRRTAPVDTYGSSATELEESDDDKSNPWRNLFTLVSGDISRVNGEELQRLGGSASECFDLVFQLREIAYGLGWVRLSDIVRGLITRLANVVLNAPAPSGQGWWQVVDYGCELLGALANAEDSSGESRDAIFNALQAWGERGVTKALVVARRLRNEPT